MNLIISFLGPSKEMQRIKVFKASALWAFDKSKCLDYIDVRRIHTRLHDEKLLRQTRPLDPSYRKSLRFWIIDSWNKLDNDVRAIDEKGSFIRWLKTHYKELISTYDDQTWI